MRTTVGGKVLSRIMRMELDDPPGPKRPVNLTVRPGLLKAAREAGVNFSALLEQALEEELVRLNWWRWRRQNAASIESYNRHVKKHRPFSNILLRW